MWFPLLASEPIEKIPKGTAPESLSLERLYEQMPVLWEEQRRIFGLSVVTS